MEDKSCLYLSQLEMDKLENLYALVSEIKSGEKDLNKLTKTQKNDVYNFLILEVERKRLELQDLNNKIFNNKTRDIQNIDISNILNRLSVDVRNEFLEFLVHVKHI